MAYPAAAWLGFGEALTAVAGALTGLLFVAPQPRLAPRPGVVKARESGGRAGRP
jgi:hypothetical protein